MKRVTTVICFELCMILTLPAQSVDTPAMLDRALPGVLTIALNETTQTGAVLGAASASRLDKAYERVLDLSDAKGTGSGFVIKRGAKAWVVTNAHVIANAATRDDIYAYSINQTRYRLRVFGGDSFYDIALLEFVEPAVPGPEVIPMQFRESEARVGETVYALGNPLGQYPYSVSNGIIGGKNRFLSGPTGRLGYLQHTATIIWGNSGGPLIDIGGRVVGINTRIEITAVVHPQLNFALDGILARRLIDELIDDKGRLMRAYLGLELSQSSAVNQFRKFGSSEAVIEAVVPGGPAAALAKYVGAQVDRIGDQVTRNLDEALAAIEELKPGQKVELELSKNGITSTATIETVVLTDERKTQLVRSAFERHLHLEVGDTSDGVVLKQAGAPASKDPASSAGLPKLRGIGSGTVNNPQGRPSDEILVVAVGLVPDDRSGGEPLLYKVNRTEDLAISLRLMLMLGRVDFIVAVRGSQEPQVSRWIPSGAPNIVKRMLIC